MVNESRSSERTERTADTEHRVDRRAFLASAGAAGAVALAGCSSNSGGSGESGGTATTGNGGSGSESYTIKIGSTYEPEHILVKTAKRFGKNLEEKTDGRITANVIPGGALGSEEAITQAVQSGSVDAHVGGHIPVSMYASKYYFVDTPYVIKDWDHFKRVWNGEAFKEGKKLLRQKGNQRPLGVIYRGIRHYTSNKPVKSVDDVQGMDLRLPQLEDWLKIWKKVGVSPTSVALDELYSALQQGVADASEGPAQQVSSFSLHEVQSHYSLTSHMVQTGGFYMNDDFFTGLSTEDQKLVKEASNEATTWGSEKAISSEESLIKGLEDKGMTVVRDVDTESFRKAAIPAVKDLFESKFAASWDQIQNA